MQIEAEFEFQIKLAIIGDSAVGKTNFIFRFIDNLFSSSYVTTVGFDYKSKIVKLPKSKKRVKIQIWDTAGQEKYRSLAKIFYKDARIIILVYSIENLKSYESLKDYWYQEVKTNGLSNVIYAVVGNKNDLYNNAQVKEKDAMEWADSIGAIFQLTSAKSNSGIDLLFSNLAKKFFDPDYDYKKEDEEAKKIYEMKKKEKEENKKKKREDDNGIKLPKVETVKLNSKDHVNDTNHKKGGCC